MVLDNVKVGIIKALVSSFFFNENKKSATKQNGEKITYLQKATLAIRCIHQCANFELFKTQSQHPVSWCATKTTKAIPTCHRPSTVLICYFRWCNILINVNSFVAMILKCFGWTSWKRGESFFNLLFDYLDRLFKLLGKSLKIIFVEVFFVFSFWKIYLNLAFIAPRNLKV